MAVSPADFYAYSQATGTPVPQDKRSQALLAPAVFQWRKSQLQRAENEGNVVDTVGKVALGAGALAGGGFGARRLVRALRSAPQAAQKLENVIDTARESEAVIKNVTSGTDTSSRAPTVDLPERGTLVTHHQSQNNRVADQALDAAQSSSDQLDQIAESQIQKQTDSIKYGKAQVLQEEIRDAQIRETKPGFTPDYTKKGLTQADLDVLNQTQVGKVLQSERYGGELSPQGDIEIRTRSGSEGLSAASASTVYTTDSLKARPGITGQEIRDRTLAAAKFDRGSTEQNLLLNPNVATEDVRDLLTTTYVETPRGGYINPTDEVIGGARASMTDVEPVVDDGLSFKYVGAQADENLEGQMSSAGFLDEFIDKDMDGSRGVENFGGPLSETESYVERIRGKGTTNVPGQVELVDSPGTVGSTRQERRVDTVIPTRSDAGEAGTGILFKDDPEISVLDTITDKPRTTTQTDVLDRQLTLQGSAKRDLSAWANDPRYLNEYGEVDPKKIPLRERLQAPLISNDVNIEGSKKVGNIESVAPEQAFTLGQQADGSNISIIQGTQKDPNRLIVVRNQRGQGGKPITQQIWDMPEADNLLTFNQTIESGSDVLNTQPYMFGVVERDPRTGQEYLGTRAKRGPLLQRVTNTRGQTELVPTQVSRSELRDMANRAAIKWESPSEVYGGKSVKQTWMEANAKDAVDPRTKAFVEKPYHKNTFIAQQIKKELAAGKVVKKADIPIAKTKPMLTGDGRVLPGQNIAIGPVGPEKTTRVGQIDLPVLDDTRSGAADRFVQDLMRTSGDSEFRGRPLPEGPNLRARKKLVDWEADKVVVPGVTRETKGLGGIDPMQLEDAASSENVAYFTPRLESKPPQQKPKTLSSQRKELWDVGLDSPGRQGTAGLNFKDPNSQQIITNLEGGEKGSLMASQASVDNLTKKVDNLAKRMDTSQLQNSLLVQSDKSARRARGRSGKGRGR